MDALNVCSFWASNSSLRIKLGATIQWNQSKIKMIWKFFLLAILFWWIGNKFLSLEVYFVFWMCLTHFQPMLHFCSPRKHQKTGGFKEYGSETLVENGLKLCSIIIIIFSYNEINFLNCLGFFKCLNNAHSFSRHFFHICKLVNEIIRNPK